MQTDIKIIDTTKPPTKYCLLAIDNSGWVHAHTISTTNNTQTKKELATIVNRETNLQHIRIAIRKTWSNGIPLIPQRIRPDEIDDSEPYNFDKHGKIIP